MEEVRDVDDLFELSMENSAVVFPNSYESVVFIWLNYGVLLKV